METLQTYLDTQYKQDCARRTEILRLVQHTLPLFTATFKTQGWPYECHAEVFPPSVDKLSATTVAMTAGALQQTANKGLPKSVFNLCTFHPSYNTVQEGQNAVEQVIRAATMCLMDKAPDVLYSSPTYGYKSVFVLSWLLELFENVPASLLEEAEKKPIFDDVVATSCEQLSEIFKAFGNKEQIPYNKDAPELASTKETPKIDSRHAFPLLKAIRLYFSLLNISDKPGLRPETKRRIEDICFPAALLENTTDPVKEIALQTGYTDPLVFSKAFKKYFGVSPKAYRDYEDKIELRRKRETTSGENL